MFQEVMNSGGSGEMVIPEKLIPFDMTGNSQNGYVASCTGYDHSGQPYYAFDGKPSTSCACYRNRYLTLELPEPRRLAYIFLLSDSYRTMNTFEIYGSNDASNREQVKLISGTYATAGVYQRFVSENTKDAFKYLILKPITCKQLEGAEPRSNILEYWGA